MNPVRSLSASGGVNVAYRLWRPGAPRRTIVAIHGLASNLTRWSEFAATTRLAESWDILSLDLRGHGGSLHRGRVGFDEWCADIGELLRAEGIAEAVLLGHCLGANVALWFAHRQPQRVKGMVLIEPMFRQALAGEMLKAIRLRSGIAAVVPLLRGLAALGLHRRHLEMIDLAELDREARAAMTGEGGFPVARYSSIREDLRGVPLTVYLQDLLAVTGPLPDLPGLAGPTLALLSSGTAFTDPEITARLLAELPDCRIVRLDAQHWIPTEQPEAMRHAIEDWCDERFGR
ncbi:MAG: alpha/beta hydrolase [Rhodocyclales bacterium]|jgi:pimeloyl-ACP methyl ester carboxylesterase|nr:alpha/beta hydrolase [Rhodocyclales bacterium]